MHRAPVGQPIATHFGRLAADHTPTACGRTRVPATTDWRHVCCWTCLGFCPPTPWLEAHRAEAKGKYREWFERPDELVTPVELYVRCAAATGEAGWACVGCTRPLCRACGDRDPSACGWCDG